MVRLRGPLAARFAVRGAWADALGRAQALSLWACTDRYHAIHGRNKPDRSDLRPSPSAAGPVSLVVSKSRRLLFEVAIFVQEAAFQSEVTSVLGGSCVWSVAGRALALALHMSAEAAIRSPWVTYSHIECPPHRSNAGRFL